MKFLKENINWFWRIPVNLITVPINVCSDNPVALIIGFSCAVVLLLDLGQWISLYAPKGS